MAGAVAAVWVRSWVAGSGADASGGSGDDGAGAAKMEVRHEPGRGDAGQFLYNITRGWHQCGVRQRIISISQLAAASGAS